jgi:L-threonylcarbamoyladenylate synthase
MADLFQTEIKKSDDLSALSKAISIITSHQLVAFPTDTVYGLGASIDSTQAIEQLYLVKGRDTSKAIAVLLGDQAALPKIAAKMNRMAERLAERFWPGPLTLVVARRPELPANLSPTGTIGVRMPDHPIALRLLRKSGPLAVTSANLSGAPNTTTAQEVYDQLRGRIPMILDGGSTPGGRPSTVVDCTADEPLVLRQGPITRKQLLAALA